ncbi:thioredoxin domain protein [Desulfitobacterium dichloroeliminans LMG P-21439]|uniref:Thioredoxin domain protein n=1 Tax=Desulfitobacterium dichloroeliminans (strain LMG P-21439 / DCA1) TaxID=871963 RepID=L0F9V4_DESDL|nr:thioredoxin domain-containing protein [Desulfitobacterium dichloroeliminans]AGA69728.1 thioredoxin domain protein [Desulfitobacterium dichloroeliminans LMG P-21439]
MNSKNGAPNRLINEKSPYLLQHAYNPVDWYPWGQEAFAKAKTQNRPIFLSIGYSTCHWCHVMERESFEDHEVADLLNRYFIAIKVDREERPDVDHIYMEFCQALIGSGGWPLTILMTPDQKPFYAGTYFPKESRYGRPGIIDVLHQLGELWRVDEKKVLSSAESIYTAVTTHKELPNASVVSSQEDDFRPWAKVILEAAFQTFQESFDSQYGGFRQAPKFPTPHNLTFLLRYAYDHGQAPKAQQATHMVRTTLDAMGQGGIYDHIGFGFARYSTDQHWLVPHFEKMLYDNALLAIAYLESYQVQHLPRDEQKVREIFAYVLRDMVSPEGGFYSAEDADSEGVEGKFYVWTPQEIHELLGSEAGQLYCRAYDITRDGNFEGKNIPNLLHTEWTALAEEFNLSREELSLQLEEARKVLFQAREKRIHPHKDDKILTSWNGLMIAALAKGAQILDDTTYTDAAEKAVSFIINYLYPKQRLLARYRDRDSAHLGYLDDYAFLIWGLIELYSATGKKDHLGLALSLQKAQDELFLDTEQLGYFLTGHDAEELLIRPKEIYDGATPSGNSVSACNLIRLARLTGDIHWEKRANEQLMAFKSSLSTHSAGYTMFLQALQYALAQSREIVLAGPIQHAELSKMKELIFTEYRPYTTLLYQEGTLSELIPWLKDYPEDSKQSTAYICQNYSCLRPVHTAAELPSLLL